MVLSSNYFDFYVASLYSKDMKLPTGKRVLSGIQPTGVPHIGNYLGALKQWVALQNAGNKCHWFIADLHAITAPYDVGHYHTNVLTSAAALLAIGIDIEKSTLFIQSHIPAHTEATWYMTCQTKFGELSRMTQFKEKGGGKTTVSTGLFIYPILMAVDVLLYQTELVPVGEDQIQHLELTRMLARRFNSLYTHLFTEPEPYVIKEVARVMSLRDPKKKMSKSGNPNDAIFLNDSQDDIQKKIRSAVTDSGSVLDINNVGPALKNLLSIYVAFSEKSVDEVLNKFDGKGYAMIKNDVADLLIEKLTPIRNKIRDHLDNESSLMANLQLGARRANEIAQKNLREMKNRMGFTQIS